MENIHNFFEQQVSAFLDRMPHLQAEFDSNDVSDIACIALNKLPTKYYRHSIDLSFYTSSEEQQQLEQQILEAISFATYKVRHSLRNLDSDADQQLDE